MINIDEIQEKQTAQTQERTERLNQPFTIQLDILPASEAPGPVWLVQYDQSFFTILQSGYDNDFEGRQSYWCRFKPIRLGQTTIVFFQQPRLINPLYVELPFEINIIPE